ncbi:MAG: hypothetical protein JO093_00115 [Acidobacteria bacterium]|nr:hypothetical protein [Acidobacteriota bacterium]MBV9067099.1 hypothetical protein [Acidobacteriota bacterium]MBV9183987.1 hypothetical protein [Acidobacteriota bacterium]
MKPNHLKTLAATLLIGIGTTLLTTSVARAAVVTPDAVTVATVTGPQFSTVDVPVFIRDSSGTPLGLDQPAGLHIQAYAIKVDYSPAAAVQSITFTRGGVTTSLTPASESSPSSAGSISLIDSFSEATNPIPLTLNGALPGNQVATLHVTLANTATPGTIITLTLDPSSLTQLSNDSGTVGETVSNGALTLVNGSITVLPSVPALGHIALLVLAISLAFIAIRSRF